MKMKDNLRTLSDQLAAHRQSLNYAMPAELKRRLIARMLPSSLMKTRQRSWISATAACALMLLVFQLGRNTTHLNEEDVLVQEIVSSHVRSLMANHLSDVISTDQHTVKPWFEGRLDFGPDVKNFESNDFNLVGGRLDYIGNRPVAALSFKHGKHLINLFEWPSAIPSDHSPQFTSQRGYQIYSWQKNGLIYWTISDLNASELQTFAGLWN